MSLSGKKDISVLRKRGSHKKLKPVDFENHHVLFQDDKDEYNGINIICLHYNTNMYYIVTVYENIS